MADKIWRPSSADANVAGNYLPSGVPATNDTIYFTDEAAFPMTTNISAAFATKTLALVFEKGFAHYAGSSGLPMTCATWSQIIFEANTTFPSFFTSTTATTKVCINTQSQLDNICEFNGSIGRVSLLSGRVGLNAAATVTNRIGIKAINGAAQPKLTIPAGVTLTGIELAMNGGEVMCSAAIPKVKVENGQFTLAGSVGISGFVEMYGGVFYWDAADQASPSVIALAEVYGGTFKTRLNRLGRTLTEGNCFGDGMFDFSIGGLNITFTNPIRAYGSNPPRYQVGASYAKGV